MCKGKIWFVIAILINMIMTGCSQKTNPTERQEKSSSINIVSTERDSLYSEESSEENKDNEESEVNSMTLTINNKAFSVKTEENDTVRELRRVFPLTIKMSELNGNEKYHYLEHSLPASEERVGKIEEGDVMLYGENCLVIFYQSFSTPYSYTKIGHIENTDGLSEALGNGEAEVAFNLDTSTKNAGEFDFETMTVLLNSGYTMPILGLGTWTQDDATVEESVYEAIKDGYRLIDTAQYYGNEEGVGHGLTRAIEEGLVKREDIFITTKVMPSNYDRAYLSIDESLERLGVEYIDLMLIHQSGTNDTEVYRALCQGVADGKIRSIGISNYYTPEEFERVVDGNDIKPAVVQNENHPFYQNTALKEYVRQYGTVVESWYPFGGRGHTQDLFGNETIAAIAHVHQKTPAQIILRWHLQAGYVTIPGSQNQDHIKENYAIFDFELNEEEMSSMTELHTGKRYENW